VDDALVVASRQSRVASHLDHASHLDQWIADLEARHLADLTFSEVARALRALSSAYIERRARLSRGSALDGAGKRAAFALFYGPLHFLLLNEIVLRLPGFERARVIADLGCGTGAAGAAWAAACRPPARLLGIDRHPWAAAEAARTYRTFGLSARVERRSMGTRALPRQADGFVAAFALNELDGPAREQLLRQLLDRARRGARVLIVEPIAGFVAPWWAAWRAEFEAAGGRADEWRVEAALPPIVARLDRAAGLNHRVLTGRSLAAG
jgi:SAM-dependent methyltransferase